MKLTKKLNELINSGITLTKEETALVERYIADKAKQIKTKHLAHYQSLAAIRGAGSCSTFAERYRLQKSL